jgi:hypothetical protein
VAVAAEKKRKEDIRAHAAKYNKNGVLDAALAEALAGDTPLDAFKDKVTDILASTPAKDAIKPGSDGNPAGGTMTDAEFTKRYTACKTFADRRALRKEFPEFAKRLAK